MAVAMVSRCGLFKDVLPSVIRITSLSKPYGSYSPDSVKKFEDIPGPTPIPIIGNVLKCYTGSYDLDKLPQIYEGYFEKYGPLVKEYMFYGRTLVHVFKPEDMDSIYSLDQTNYPYRVSHTALEEYRLKCKSVSYRNGGLPSSNGETWAELRRLLGDDLLERHHSDAFEILSQTLVDRIYKLTAFKADRQLSLFPWLYYWSLNCVGAFTLGIHFAVDNAKYYEYYDDIIKFIRLTQTITFYTENFPRFLCLKMLKTLEYAQDSLNGYLEEPMSYPVFEAYKYENPLRRGIVVEGDIICLKNSLAHALVSRGVDVRDVRTFVIDMFQGGIHSTAHVLAFAMYYLAKHPKEQKKIRDALVANKRIVIPQYSRRPVCREINNVILETMRLNPPTIGTGRVIPEPLVLSGYNVPAFTMCILHHQIASKQETYFENPGEFHPDRFNKRPSREAEVANSPFARGKRACPGKDVAINQIGIALTAILKNFELAYEYEDVRIKSQLTNEPAGKMILTFKPSPL